MAQITTTQWAAIREFAMRSIRDTEAALIETPEDFGPLGIEAANSQLDAAMKAIREIDRGAVDLILGKAA